MDPTLSANWEVSVELVADALGCARRQVADLISAEAMKELTQRLLSNVNRRLR